MLLKTTVAVPLLSSWRHNRASIVTQEKYEEFCVSNTTTRCNASECYPVVT